MVRVLVADDQALVRGGIIMLLSGYPDLEVVGEADNGDAAVAMALRLRPDLVIMDLRMPGLDGVEATRRLTAEEDPRDDGGPGAPDHIIKVLALTSFNDDESVYGSLSAGASGFLVKDGAPEQLIDAVRAIAQGDGWIDRTVATQVIRALGAWAPTGVPDPAMLHRLTAREREVLVLMADGLSNGEISARFVLSEATVRTHVSRILMKTGSRDRTQAVVFAYRSGLVHAGG